MTDRRSARNARERCSLLAISSARYHGDNVHDGGCCLGTESRLPERRSAMVLKVIRKSQSSLRVSPHTLICATGQFDGNVSIEHTFRVSF
jgi:hypothetical protein